MVLSLFYPFDDTDDTFFLYNNIKKIKKRKKKIIYIYICREKVSSVTSRVVASLRAGKGVASKCHQSVIKFFPFASLRSARGLNVYGAHFV
jgi:hypothetical protein